MLINLNGVETLYYGYTDNQGSLIALTDASGNVVEKYAYDPWGARRNPNDWTQKDSRTAWITNRGYTGHEHLDAFDIKKGLPNYPADLFYIASSSTH